MTVVAVVVTIGLIVMFAWRERRARAQHNQERLHRVEAAAIAKITLRGARGITAKEIVGLVVPTSVSEVTNLLTPHTEGENPTLALVAGTTDRYRLAVYDQLDSAEKQVTDLEDRLPTTNVIVTVGPRGLGNGRWLIKTQKGDLCGALDVSVATGGLRGGIYPVSSRPVPPPAAPAAPPPLGDTGASDGHTATPPPPGSPAA